MRILKILLTIILVLFIGVAALLFFLPGEQIARLASDQVKDQFGRDLVIEGEVELSFFPTIGITTGPVRLSNADWATEPAMFQAKRAKIGVNTMALLGGDIHIKTISLTSPDILLERDGQGHANWDDFLAAPEEDGDEEATSSSQFTLDHFEVSNARIRYVDPQGTSLEIPDMTADFTWGEGDAVLETVAVMNGAPVAALIEIADLNGLIAGDVIEVGVAATAGKNKLIYKGLASSYPEVSGTVTLELPDPAVAMAALGQSGAGVPASDFSGDVTLTKERIFSLRDGRASLDGNDLSVEADVDLNGKPKVVASLSAGALDLKPYLGGGEGGENSEGWSTSPIDASALGLFDGSITLSAASIDLGSLNFGSSRVAIDIENARAVATLHQLTGYEGTVTGQFVANNRSGFSVGGNLDVANVAMKGVLSDLLGSERFTGQANAKLAFLGSGGSVDAIMKSLRGDGSLSVGSGTIEGIDLDQLFRGTPNSGTTIFDSMSATWTIDAGVLNNQDLLMSLPRVQAKGAGTIGLGAQNLDYTFTPEVRAQNDAAISVPVRIQGPWSGPRIWPDLEAIAKQQLGDEIQAVEDQVNEAVDQVKEDVQQQIEDRLKDELGGALNNLLGGN